MPHTVKRPIVTVLVLLIALLFALSVCVPQANATGAHDNSRSAVIYLTGRHAAGKYELNTKDLYLFSLEGTAPGDSWSGSVNVKNDTDGDMAIAVHSIASTLIQDTTLFDTLDLKIAAKGETCYRGDYAAKGSPVTGYYPVAAGERYPSISSLHSLHTQVTNARASRWTQHGRSMQCTLSPCPVASNYPAPHRTELIQTHLRLWTTLFKPVIS